MVWIHGGGFTLGHAFVYQADRYMEHDIVLVVIQYRLGPLGNYEIITNLNPSYITKNPL